MRGLDLHLRITVTSSFNEYPGISWEVWVVVTLPPTPTSAGRLLDRYLKTMGTVFPPSWIFASCVGGNNLHGINNSSADSEKEI